MNTTEWGPAQHERGGTARLRHEPVYSILLARGRCTSGYPPGHAVRADIRGVIRRAGSETSITPQDVSAMDNCRETKAALPSSDFLEEPWKIFRESLDDCLKPDDEGRKTGAVFRDALSKEDAAKVPIWKPTWKPRRSEVFALAAADCRSVEVDGVCAAAMAWGGMNLRHWKLLWEQRNREWLDVARCIRGGKLTRAKAYERFNTLREEKKLPGMGPAFFTKLIYFLTQGKDSEGKAAYIMDRWAASSVNLMTGSNRVLLNGERRWKGSENVLHVSYGFTVSDANTSDDYEAFCTAVDRLAADFCLCVDQVDCALFSEAKDGPGTWREYVDAQGEKLLHAKDRIRSD